MPEIDTSTLSAAYLDHLASLATGADFGDYVAALNPNVALALIEEIRRLRAQATQKPLPLGLCGRRDDHEPHRVPYAAVADGPMWCHANQSQRVPYALEKKN